MTKARGQITITNTDDGKAYSIAFKLNGISVGVLNYNTLRDADAAMTL